MSAGKAGPHAVKRLSNNSNHRPPGGGGHYSPHSAQYCDIPADFSKVDSILRHLQQTESHDWMGEITHCCTQVGYLLLQNYSISRFNFYNYNLHLIVLTTLFFAQRIWFSLWRVTQFTDAHGVRFACHIVLFMVLSDSLYCGMLLVLKDSFVGSLYLVTPLLCSVLFYHVYLKANTNVFTAEVFGMLARCVYHSLETAYCVGVLPLRFLQYEFIYYDTSRCIVFTSLVTMHTFLSLLCLELHCLGSEVLQQTRMLGEWRWIPDLTRLKSIPKPAEWSNHNCPYPRGAVVRCKGRYYEAVATLNTCSPTSSSHFISPVAFLLGDSQRAKASILFSLLILNIVLVLLVLWSNQWSMYAAMLIPNCGQFLYVKYKQKHAFFNPAHLNLRQLQWDLNIEMPQRYKVNGHAPPHLNNYGHDSQGWAVDEREDDDGANGVDGDGLPERPYGGSTNHLAEVLANTNVGGCLTCPNPLFLSAVSASTMFFFEPSGAVRSTDGGSNSRHEGGSSRND